MLLFLPTKVCSVINLNVILLIVGAIGTRAFTVKPKYDLVVIGGGPAGVQASLVASAPPLNKKVCLIDAPHFSGALFDDRKKEDLSIGGPTGLFSKALRDTSHRISVSTLRGMGLREESIWNEILSSCIDLASVNACDVRKQLQSSGVDYMEGKAEFGEEGGIVVHNDAGSSCTRGHKVLIATGSRPFHPDGIPFDNRRIFDSDSINQLSYLPKSIAITGSGIIAMEYAKIFSNLGVKVTVIIRDNIPRKALVKIGLDKDIAASLVADLIRCDIKFERGAQVKTFEVPEDTPGGLRGPVKLIIEGRGGKKLPCGKETKNIKCDIYMAAVGRKSNTEKLNLQAAGIQTDEYGGIKVDENLMTAEEGVYAAGDVLGRPFLASTGVAQAIAAVKHMFQDQPTDTCELEVSQSLEGQEVLCLDGNLSSTGASFDPKSLASNPFAFPVGIWSSPEVSWYGLSMLHAKELGIDAQEGIALYAECTRGQVFSPNGLLKLVFVKSTGRIIGVHICGEDACELIHYGMELIKSKRSIEDIALNLYSAITYHEMYKIAAKAGMDTAGARKRRAAIGAATAARNRARVKSADSRFQ